MTEANSTGTIRWITGPTPAAAVQLFWQSLDQWARQSPPNGPASLALTAGSSARQYYRAWRQGMAAAAPELREFWEQRVFYFWSDERQVPYSDPDSNYGMARQTLFTTSGFTAEHIFPAPVSGPPEDCARAYAQTIRQQLGAGAVPVFDLILLGLGPDGHTASLFPGTDVFADDGLLVRAVAGTPAHPHPRLSFTPRLINAARQVWFLVLGEEKKQAVEGLRARRQSPRELPALAVDPRQTPVTCFLDAAAAGAPAR